MLRFTIVLVRFAFLTAALAAVSISLSGSRRGDAAFPSAAQGACPSQFTIDFSGLPAGTIIGEQYAAFGVHISGIANVGFPDALIAFDTNAPPTHDPDLAVDIGNIAIFANNLTDANGDGLVDDPDENNFGGRAIFAFDQDVSIGSYLFVDKDTASPNVAVAYNAAGEVLVTVPVPQGANGSVQRIEVNADGVRRLELVYRESGGFTGIEVACEQATPTPTPLPTPSPTPTPVPVGGIAGLAAGSSDVPAGVSDPSGSDGAGPIAAAVTAGAVALLAGGWYAKQRLR
jgi:hypothetical protein